MLVGKVGVVMSGFSLSEYKKLLVQKRDDLATANSALEAWNRIEPAKDSRDHAQWFELWDEAEEMVLDLEQQILALEFYVDGKSRKQNSTTHV